jgi:putative tryptophan/tyrosine transport system substrate-binding protein
MALLVDAQTNVVANVDALQEAARAHNIELSIHRIAQGEQIAAAVDAAKALGAEAVNFSASPLFFTHRHFIMDRLAALRLPAIYEWPETAEEGGFAAYGPRLDQLFVEVMTQQLIKLFRGSKVADIPVEQATKFELVINLKTANAMGVTVPPALLVRADKVIE